MLAMGSSDHQFLWNSRRRRLCYFLLAIMSQQRKCAPRKLERRERSPTPENSQIMFPDVEEIHPGGAGADQLNSTPVDADHYSSEEVIDSSQVTGRDGSPIIHRRKALATPYKFTSDQQTQIIEYIKAHPALYDKGVEGWKNRLLKDKLWADLALQFHECTVDQIKKFYNQSRTTFGKIENRLLRSGSAAGVPRTYTEKFILQNWAFLKGHVAHHGATMNNDPASSSSVPPKKKKIVPADRSSSDESDVSVGSNPRRSPAAAAADIEKLTSILDTCSSRLTAVKDDEPYNPLKRRVDDFYPYFKSCFLLLHHDDAFDVEQELLGVLTKHIRKRKEAAPPAAAPAAPSALPQANVPAHHVPPPSLSVHHVPAPPPSAYNFHQYSTTTTPAPPATSNYGYWPQHQFASNYTAPNTPQNQFFTLQNVESPSPSVIKPTSQAVMPESIETPQKERPVD